MRSTVRSMSAGFSVAFRMWLSHLDNCLSCCGSARASAQHGRSVQDVSFASGCQRPARLAVGHAALRAGGMPVQSDRRAGGVADQRSGAHEHGRHGWLLAARGCAMFVRVQIGMVSQAELVLRLGRTMSIRFREAMGGAQQRNVERLDPGVAGHRYEFDARGRDQHHREQLHRRNTIPVPRTDESARKSPREEHMRMILKPSSFWSEVGMFGLQRWPHCGGE